MTRELRYSEARQYAITSIHDFLEGTGGQWDRRFHIDSDVVPALEAVQNLGARVFVNHPHPVFYCNEEGFNVMRQKT
jgi:hypothetical protein